MLTFILKPFTGVEISTGLTLSIAKSFRQKSEITSTHVTKN